MQHSQMMDWVTYKRRWRENDLATDCDSTGLIASSIEVSMSFTVETTHCVKHWSVHVFHSWRTHCLKYWSVHVFRSWNDSLRQALKCPCLSQVKGLIASSIEVSMSFTGERTHCVKYWSVHVFHRWKDSLPQVLKCPCLSQVKWLIAPSIEVSMSFAAEMTHCVKYWSVHVFHRWKDSLRQVLKCPCLSQLNVSRFSLSLLCFLSNGSQLLFANITIILRLTKQQRH